MARGVPSRLLVVSALLASSLLPGCTAWSVLTDFTSVSIGTFRRGILRNGRRLPPRGEGYVVPPLWVQRGNQYGTDELVDAIERAARRVRREYPGSLLGVGDLSPRHGGGTVVHRSHQDGRDADLIFYATDARGRPVMPTSAMPRYGANLRSLPRARNSHYGPFSPRRFDVARNWALVRALLSDPHIAVQYLFCSVPLKQALLRHAHTIGDDPELIEKAGMLLHQPTDSLPHDDHLHLRIYCAADDRIYGCADYGPVRWWKKRYKYLPPGAVNLAYEVAVLAADVFPQLKAITGE